MIDSSRRNLIYVLMLTLFSSGAQSQTITGKVVSGDDGETLPGVTVLLKDTGTGDITDNEGNYRINLSGEGHALVFSYVGFITQEIQVSSRTVINVSLELSLDELEEVVVIGYGALRRSDMTGAVTSIGGDELSQVPFSDPIQGLQGKVAGLQVLNSSGDPGSAPIVRLRGVTTLNNNNPLFVVDGVIIDVAQESSGSSLDFVNPNDIASVEVLKDASATAIFGARGSNGVIIITTKSGSKGEAKINLNVEHGWETISNKLELMNTSEFANYINAINPGTYNNIGALPDVDWQDEIYKSKTPIRNYSLSFSGGNETLTYYSSFGYYFQEGVLSKSDFERVNGKVNINYQVRERVKLGLNLNVAHYSKQNAPGVVNATYWAWPVNSPTDANGNFLEVNGAGNPAAAIEFSNSFRRNIRSLGNLYLEVEPIDGVTFKSSVQFDGDFAKQTSFTPVFFVAPLQQNETSDINKTFSNSFQWVWENTVSFNKVWDQHRINAVAGYTAQERTSEFISGHTENLLRDEELFWYLNGGEVNAEERTLGNSGAHSAIVSWLFRLNYVFSKRYLFTVTGRRDASSNFGNNSRSGFFPSAALGWNFHEESFFPVSSVVNQFKVRASWGIVGNEKIGFRDQYSTVGGGVDAVFNDTLVPGATFTSPGNPDLKWEQTEQYNFGFETAAFDARLKAEADYYVKNSSDILVNLNAPGYFGYGAFVQFRANAADVQNKGFEFSLNWEDDIGEFTYQIGFNGSTIKNEVKSLGDVGADSVLVAGGLGNGQNITRTVVGQSIGFFYGYEIGGVFQDADQLSNTPSLINQGVGDFIFNDRNNDGVINDSDKIYLGSSIPSFIYGFSTEFGYKGFRLGMNFQGQIGSQIYNGKSTIRFAQLNYEKRFNEFWTGPNSTNEHPRASSGGANYLPSEYFIESGDYLRLRTLSLSYDVSADFLEVIGLSGARVYVRGTNLLTITDFSGYSPDIGSASALDGVIDNGRYPQTRIYSIGMNLNF